MHDQKHPPARPTEIPTDRWKHLKDAIDDIDRDWVIAFCATAMLAIALGWGW